MLDLFKKRSGIEGEGGGGDARPQQIPTRSQGVIDGGYITALKIDLYQYICVVW